MLLALILAAAASASAPPPPAAPRKSARDIMEMQMESRADAHPLPPMTGSEASAIEKKLTMATGRPLSPPNDTLNTDSSGGGGSSGGAAGH
jgi:hypothetical protein